MEGLPYDLQKIIFSHICSEGTKIWELRHLPRMNRKWRAAAVRYVIEMVPKEDFSQRVRFMLVRWYDPQFGDWNLYTRLCETWSPPKFAGFLMALEYSTHYMDTLLDTYAARICQDLFYDRIIQCFCQEDGILKDVRTSRKLTLSWVTAKTEVEEAQQRLVAAEAVLKMQERQIAALNEKWKSK